MKITFMGAGSTIFARNVLGDCMCVESLRDAEMALYDIDGQRLQRRDVQHLDTPSPTPLSGNVSRALRSGHGTGAVQTIRLSRHQAVDGREERA